MKRQLQPMHSLGATLTVLASLVVGPQAVRAEQPSPVTLTDTVTAPAHDLTGLQQALTERGWHANLAPDGSLLVYPPGTNKRKAAPPTPRTGFDDLRVALEPHGWGVHQQTDGSLVLLPASRAPATDATGDEPVQGAQEEVVPASDLKRLRSVLKARGWWVEDGAGGGLTLYPRERDDTREQGLTSSLQGYTPLTLAVADLALPVDTWNEANRLANAWLAMSGRGESELAVGRIRKVNHVYLVSIVERKRPHRLRTQLAIRAPDGWLIPVFNAAN